MVGVCLSTLFWPHFEQRQQIRLVLKASSVIVVWYSSMVTSRGWGAFLKFCALVDVCVGCVRVVVGWGWKQVEVKIVFMAARGRGNTMVQTKKESCKKEPLLSARVVTMAHVIFIAVGSFLLCLKPKKKPQD